MFAELDNNFPKTTQQVEKFSTRELQDLFNTILATIINWAESEDISSEKELKRLSAEIQSVRAAAEKKSKNSNLKKSTIAIIAINLINLINSWQDLSDEEKTENLNSHRAQIRDYKKKYRSSKSGR